MKISQDPPKPIAHSPAFAESKISQCPKTSSWSPHRTQQARCRHAEGCAPLSPGIDPKKARCGRA